MGSGRIGPGIRGERRDADLHIIIIGHGRTRVRRHGFDGTTAMGPGSIRAGSVWLRLPRAQYAGSAWGRAQGPTDLAPLAF